MKFNLKFNQLEIPKQWREYWTKYPHGYTIIEALCSWLTTVNHVIENQNQLGQYMDDFINTFQGELKAEVKTTLEEWRQSGFLDVVITEVLHDIEENLTERVDQAEAALESGLQTMGDELDNMQTALTQALADMMPLAATAGTSDIESKLATDKIAHLAAGNFVVDNLTINDEETVRGSGLGTRLNQGDGECVISLAGQHGCIESLKGVGKGTPERPHNVGEGCGIVAEGMYIVRNTIDRVQMERFPQSGLLIQGTGGGVTGNIISNYMARYCGVGLDIGRQAEYCHVSNANIRDCHIGCQNNGGNNIFNACSFSGNNIGFQIDGAGNPNHGHGVISNSFMKHNDLYSALVLNCVYQYVFNSCQISANSSGVAALIQNSNGIVFTGCRFGAESLIIVDGGGLTLLEGCIFNTPPTILAVRGATVVLRDCYAPDGTEITQAHVIQAENPKWLYLIGSFYSDMGDMGNYYTIATHVPIVAKNRHHLIQIDDTDSAQGYKCGIASTSKISTAGYSKIHAIVNDGYVESPTHSGVLLGLYSSRDRAESIATNRVAYKSWISGYHITLDVTSYQDEYYIVLMAYTGVTPTVSVRVRPRLIWME